MSEGVDLELINNPKHHVLITGTGRAGTTFLIKLLTAVGLDTGFNINSNIQKIANAGLEYNRIDEDSPYIIKSPEISDQLEDYLIRDNIIFDHIFIPVRNSFAAAKSRAEVTRRAREFHNSDNHAETNIPGGLVHTNDPGQQEAILIKRLYDLVELLAGTDIPVTFIHYPRLVLDDEYLYRKLQPVMDGISYSSFKTAFEEIVDPGLVHSYSKEDAWNIENFVSKADSRREKSCTGADKIYTGTLFYDQGNGFLPGNSITCKYAREGVLEFDLSEISNIRQLRLDPLEEPLVMRFIDAHFGFCGELVPARPAHSNQINGNNDSCWVFETNDPSIYFNIIPGNIDKFIVKLRVTCTGERVAGWLLPYKNEQLNTVLKKYNALYKQTRVKNTLAKLTSNVEKLFFMESIVNQVLRFASNLIKYRKYYTWNDIVKTKNSGFFDDDYYLKQNPDVVMSDLTPFKHYIQFGCFEGSMPFNGFESYLLRKGNFKKNLIDFVRDPASYEEKTRDLWLGGCKLMEFDSDVQVLQTVSETIAVHVHLFYMSMTDKIVNHLKNIPYKFDIYISIPDPLKLDFIEELFLQSFPESKVTVRVVENRGRDMAPLFVEFASYINKYDIVCHVHTKKSPHLDNLSFWSDYLFSHVLGSENIVQSIVTKIIESPDVGIVYPLHYPRVIPAVALGLTDSEFSRFNSLANELGIDSIRDKYLMRFPSGSFFWARTDAIRPLLNAGIAIDDFELEKGKTSGTFPHVLERMLGYLPEALGYKPVITRQDLA